MGVAGRGKPEPGVRGCSLPGTWQPVRFFQEGLLGTSQAFYLLEIALVIRLQVLGSHEQLLDSAWMALSVCAYPAVQACRCAPSLQRICGHGRANRALICMSTWCTCTGQESKLPFERLAFLQPLSYRLTATRGGER